MNEQVSEQAEDALFDIRAGRYFAAMWFIPLELPQDREGHVYGAGDFMAALYRDEEGGDFTLAFRFRYYMDDKTFDSEDKKVEYKANLGANETEAMATVALMTDGIAGMRRNTKVHKLILRSSDPLFVVDRMAREDFIHVEWRPQP
jgi:hypothetical protein